MRKNVPICLENKYLAAYYSEYFNFLISVIQLIIFDMSSEKSEML